MDDTVVPKPKLSEGVTAVMLTGSDPDRLYFARVALRCFLEQSYKDRQLLIINKSDEYDVITDPIPGVREILVTADQTPTQMWNVALQHVDTPWITPWNENEWCHPHLLTFLMAHRVPGCAVVPRTMLFVDFENNKVGVVANQVDHSNTFLFPRAEAFASEAQPERNPSHPNFFSKVFSQQRYTVVENDADDWPGSALRIRFSLNDDPQLNPVVASMRSAMDKESVTDDHSSLLKDVMPSFYGIGVGVKPTDKETV